MKRGDQYVLKHDGRIVYFIQITRVAKNRSWCDIRVMNWAVSWGKRMTAAGWLSGLAAEQPKLAKQAWDQSDLDKQESEWMKAHELELKEA